MEREYIVLNKSERAWVSDNVALTSQLLADAGIRAESGADFPAALDTLWAGWLRDHPRGTDDPNRIINALGLAFGQHLVDEHGLEWIAVKDKHGTEIAVLDPDFDLLTFPTNAVAKRYQSGELGFFATFAAKFGERVKQLRDSSDA